MNHATDCAPLKLLAPQIRDKYRNLFKLAKHWYNSQKVTNLVNLAETFRMNYQSYIAQKPLHCIKARFSFSFVWDFNACKKCDNRS